MPITSTEPRVDELAFLQRYFEEFHRAVRASEELCEQFVQMKHTLVSAHRAGRKAIIIGNGGSAAMASHVAVGLTKSAGVRAINFNEADLITCLANDYGYEQWMAKAVELYGEPGDVLIAISSSGKSNNILNACAAARRKSFASVITFSGFSPENPLRGLGDQNFWVDSLAYNLVEATHQLWLLAVVDLIIGKTEYPAS